MLRWRVPWHNYKSSVASDIRSLCLQQACPQAGFRTKKQPASSALRYEHTLSEPPIRLWDDSRHMGQLMQLIFEQEKFLAILKINQRDDYEFLKTEASY
jgi:hypothetical protein